LHHRFKEIDGIDMNAAMLDYAKQSASDRAITHIRWHESAAEDVQATTDSYRLVTIGNEIQ
jgi:ubiquinone/menaquinone biosynthesis C-methylase UbiE